jgi:hypothetical protein
VARAWVSQVVGYTGASSNLDVYIVKGDVAQTLNTGTAGCGDTVATATVPASGIPVATATVQPASTYYIVVDGRGGSVASYNLNVTLN